jgi:hypothetical protein
VATNKQPTPWWQSTLMNFLAPAAIAALVAAGVSVYTSMSAEREKSRAYQTSFEQLIDTQVTKNKIFTNAGDVSDEQRAAVTLLALRGLAETESQRELVLTLAARLIAVNPNPNTGGPSARVLTVLTQEIDDDLLAGRDRDASQRLHDVTRSRAFVDLVTSGISDQYYDDSTDERRMDYWPTLNGDEPIRMPAIRNLLFQLGPNRDKIDGWVHLATFGTQYRYQKDAGSLPASPVKAAIAENFIASTTSVAGGDLSKAAGVRSQYAIEIPASTQSVANPLPIKATSWQSRLPKGVLMLEARLLRSLPPVVYVNPDGTFREGSLGRVIGAVPAATCVDIIEPVRYMLVFVDSKYVRSERGPSHWFGLIHLWAHVHASENGCRFPLPVGQPPSS